MRKSKNAVTLIQLQIACRHVEEMMAEGVSENLAIRTLELFADMYAKVHNGSGATPHHVSQVVLWSKAAKSLKKKQPDGKPKDFLRVEHGTPRRGFARKVMKLYQKKKLTDRAMAGLVKRYWKLAVITLEEDQRLNKGARSKPFATPEQRWASANIKF